MCEKAHGAVHPFREGVFAAQDADFGFGERLTFPEFGGFNQAQTEGKLVVEEDIDPRSVSFLNLQCGDHMRHAVSQRSHKSIQP